MSILKTNGAEIYYEVHGQGEPLALLAGITCDIGMWAAVLEDLSKKFQVIMIDNRGVGRTQYAGSFSIDTLADDAIALLNHLNIKKAHILGHSMGGTIAQSVAARYGSRVNKLIISHSSFKFNPAMILAFKHLLHLKEANADAKTLTEASAPWVFSHAFLAQPDSVQTLTEFNQNAPYPQTVAGYKDQYNALCEFDSSNWLKEINSPTLVLAGEEDITAPASESKKLTTVLKAEFMLMAGAHVPVVEIPQEYAQVVTRFLVKL